MAFTTDSTITKDSSPQIRELTPSMINKIAAGEVIERPASVVKELLENSVDAGSTRIEVMLEQGGTEMIRITDDGHGIAEDQLELAVTSHATSKLSEAEDLFRVGTFGFRGEALASIAEVSQLVVRSRTANQNSGFELRVNGGQREPIQPCGAPVGTTIEVKQLFYNTPVRRKFLKTAQTEKAHIAEAFTRVALAYPHVQMNLFNNGKAIYQLPATERWSERIATFFGPEIANGLIFVSSDKGDAKINGYVVDPSVSRSNNKLQYLFLNNRYIKDRSLQHALREAYRGLIMTGRFPACFLRLEIPYEMVDVNVHPAKLEVRFQNSGPLYSQLLSVIRNRFLTTDLTAKAHLERVELEPAPGNALELKSPPVEVQDRIAFDNQRPTRDWTRAPGTASTSGPVSSFPAGPTPQPSRSDGQTPEPHHPKHPFPWETDNARHETANQNRPSALQVHNTYLITETEEGMVVIDQHALHERIIYEQLREKVLSEKLETQKLLVPEPVALPPAEAAAVLERAELLLQIGIEIEPFGGDTVLVSAYPAMLANHNPAEMLRSVIDKLVDPNSNLDQRDLVDELLHMISCKAAVKAGDQLTPEEITALLDHRELCQDAHHCPHGRPTALVFSRQELDRRFKRI